MSFKKLWEHNIFLRVGLELLPPQLLCSLAVTCGVPTPSFTVPAGRNSQAGIHRQSITAWLGRGDCCPAERFCEILGGDNDAGLALSITSLGHQASN